MLEEVLQVLDAESQAEKQTNERAEALLGIAFQHLFGKRDSDCATTTTLIDQNLETARYIYHMNENFEKEAMVLDAQGNFYHQQAQVTEAKRSLEASLKLRNRHLKGVQRDRESAASAAYLRG